MRTFLMSSFIFLRLFATAQNYYGYQFGTGVPAFFPIDGVPREHNSSYFRPVFEVSCSRKIVSHLYAEAKLLFHQYSFDHNYSSGVYNNYSFQVDLKHKSSYLLLAPTINFGIGKREIVHLYLMLAPGMLVDGYETTRFTDTTTNIHGSSKDISRFIVRLGLGMEEHCPLQSTLYDVVFSQGFSSILTDLTTMDHFAYVNGVRVDKLRPAHFTFQFGVRRKIRRRRSVTVHQ